MDNLQRDCDGTSPPPKKIKDHDNDDSSYCLRNRGSRLDRQARIALAKACLENAGEERRQSHETTDYSKSHPEAPRPEYEHMRSNDYSLVSTKSISRCKAAQVKRWACDCEVPSPEELMHGVLPCGLGCINRSLNIECSSRCPVYEICSNRRFEQLLYAPCEPFYAGPSKGWGLRASKQIHKSQFVIEYVGEVIQFSEFRRRIHKYEKMNHSHHYFMALGSDTFIDAGTKGNWARFINHSCEPNCETQKWNVSGLICIGIFANQTIQAGDEITIDYQFMQYGLKEQACYCGAKSCSGIMGVTNKQLQQKVRFKDTKHIEKRILKLIALETLRNADDMTLLLQVMVQECLTQYTRLLLLQLLAKTTNESLLKFFMQYNGLELVASYMVDACKEDWPLKKQILLCLDKIPVTEQKQVDGDSNMMEMVEQWKTDPRYNRAQQDCVSSTSTGPSPTVQESPPKTSPSDDDLEIIGEVPVCETQPEPPASAPPLSLEEQQIMIEEIKQLAASIHERWSGLIYETYRIPRKERQETEQALSELAKDSVLETRRDSQSSWLLDLATSPILSRSSCKRRKTKCPVDSDARDSYRRQFEAQIREQELCEKRRLFQDNLERNISQMGMEGRKVLTETISKALIGHVASLQQKAQSFSSVKEAKLLLDKKISEISTKLIPLFENKDTVGLVRYLIEVTDDLDTVMDLFEGFFTGKITIKENNKSVATVTWKLPRHWTTAVCKETSKVYYFNPRSGQSQWEPPEGSKQVTPEQMEREHKVRKEVHTSVLKMLRPYLLPNCLTGRIQSNDDYLYLAKKLSQNFMNKEPADVIMQEDTSSSDAKSLLVESRKTRLKKMINQYMTSRGAVYQRKKSNA
ncbi:Histone-lysine N-methyltransferase setd2 [Cichlidogyrus casuarinus]|uniref:[histone H3]-lysine(36) N-trimethyltransferase n=1 Tax=Cichlidogyrus casuarinus TaxID=1844966 RepID=A0ABD2Q8M6_9PLAT